MTMRGMGREVRVIENLSRAWVYLAAANRVEYERDDISPEAICTYTHTVRAAALIPRLQIESESIAFGYLVNQEFSGKCCQTDQQHEPLLSATTDCPFFTSI
jgi:hypothetical protein